LDPPISKDVLFNNSLEDASIERKEEFISFKSKDLETVYQLYPRKDGKGVALKKIESALKLIATGKVKPDFEVDHWPPADPIAWLCSRVLAFARSDKGMGERQFIPMPSTWFYQQRYLTADSEWGSGSSDSNQYPDGSGTRPLRSADEIDPEIFSVKRDDRAGSKSGPDESNHRAGSYDADGKPESSNDVAPAPGDQPEGGAKVRAPGVHAVDPLSRMEALFGECVGDPDSGCDWGDSGGEAAP
jgi:hypothetical protein